VAATSILRVYRIPFWGFNLSPFRVVYLAWVALFLKDLLVRKFTFTKDYLFLIALLASLVALNVIDVLRMEDIERYGRDSAEHLVDLSLVLLVALYTRTEESFEVLVRAIVFSSILALAIAVYVGVYGQVPLEQFLMENRSEFITRPELVVTSNSIIRNASCFYDPTFYGLYLCFVIAFCFYLMYFVRPSKPVYFPILVVNVIALFMSTSRSALVGFAVFLFVALVFVPESKKLLYALFGAVLLAVLIAVFELRALASPSDFVDQLISADSSYSRLELIMNGYESWLRAPIFGSGTESLLGPGQTIPSAHLAYLSLLAKFGLFGFAFYLVFLLTPVVVVLAKGQTIPRKYRFLVIGMYLPVFFMYFFYDFLAFLEFQYLCFGIGYSVILNHHGHSANLETLPATVPSSGE
jgi:O-antigen ligase